MGGADQWKHIMGAYHDVIKCCKCRNIIAQPGLIQIGTDHFVTREKQWYSRIEYIIVHYSTV